MANSLLLSTYKSWSTLSSGICYVHSHDVVDWSNNWTQGLLTCFFPHISYTSWPSSVTRVHLHEISAVDELVAPEKAIKWTLRISLGHNIVVTVKPPDSVNWGKRKRIFSCSCNVRDTQMTEHVNVREHCVVSEKTDCFSAGCVDTFYKTLMRCTIRAQPSS